MHQLIDKKKKIIIYLLILFLLSTISVKFSENQNNHSSKINKINIEGLSSNYSSKIYTELDSLFLFKSTGIKCLVQLNLSPKESFMIMKQNIVPMLKLST